MTDMTILFVKFNFPGKMLHCIIWAWTKIFCICLIFKDSEVLNKCDNVSFQWNSLFLEDILGSLPQAMHSMAIYKSNEMKKKIIIIKEFIISTFKCLGIPTCLILINFYSIIPKLISRY